MDTTASRAGATNADAIKTIGEKIHGIRIAMLTTVDEDGALRTRPMATQDLQPDGVLWFFTQTSAPKVGDIQRDQQVSVGYAKPDDDLYVALSGTAQLVRDRQKIDELWKPLLKAWFPNGKDDPELALLRVTVNDAEYWDGPSSKLVQLALIAKNLVTGQQGVGGENAKLDVR